MRVRRSPRLAALLLCTTGYGAAAEPYIPASDETVLATVGRPDGIGAEEIRKLRKLLMAHPADAPTAARLARIYADLNSSSGEPRYLGYAKSILAPWEDVAEPPDELWLIRARITQRMHGFEDAQRDLASLLRRHPANSEGAFLQSTVAIVRSDFATAREACAKLAALRQTLLATICSANLSLYSAAPQDGARAVEAVLGRGMLPAELETWVHTLAAELAVAHGAERDAERHYRAAISAMPRDAPDLYTLGSYADFLIDRGDGQAAFALLESAPATDSVLIRRAVAAGDATGRAHVVEQLRNRMAVLIRRDDDAHMRELAWAHLHVLGDTRAGLMYARRNWQQQREMRDARLLLEAAFAAHEPEAARPVIEWVDRNGIQHAWLNGLIERWRGAATP